MKQKRSWNPEHSVKQVPASGDRTQSTGDFGVKGAGIYIHLLLQDPGRLSVQHGGGAWRVPKGYQWDSSVPCAYQLLTKQMVILSLVHLDGSV